MQRLDTVLSRLTADTAPHADLLRLLGDFADELGWRPSDRLSIPALSDIANGHLVAEHGLENTAVITFLRRSVRFADLRPNDVRRLLNVSYNNLVDWHIGVQADEVTFIYNRTNPPTVVDNCRLFNGDYAMLRSVAFEQVTGKRPNPNLRSLDDALIDTISYWKRNLSAEMRYAVPNEALSLLFNAIIFARAAEDDQRRYLSPAELSARQSLFDFSEANMGTPLARLLERGLKQAVGGDIPGYLFDPGALSQFDMLEGATVRALLGDFYQNKFAPYEYDFSLISKHSLSRIYEHYVSLLRVVTTSQGTLFPVLPDEQRNKAYGSVYTPQFIARFFGRFLREQLPPSAFRRLRTIDPACGSGIFLRTLLELQCESSADGPSQQAIESASQNLTGLDVDANACHAARLSLALLYLVLRNQLPQSIDVIQAEAIEYCVSHPETHGTYDAVVANPPYVSLDDQSADMRQRVQEYMGDHASGRIDAYLPFLQIALDLLKPGGFGLFVLPHSFLIGRAASRIRKQLSERCWIRCLADLSAVEVFGDLGSYVVLVVFQKKLPGYGDEPAATVVDVREFVGHALMAAVEGLATDTDFYNVYQVNQKAFSRDEWLVAPPAESRLRSKLEELPLLSQFMIVRQGLITGADDVFILDSLQVPSGEESVYAPFLPDRSMLQYTVPRETNRVVFYPFRDGLKLTEDELREHYPGTWVYLERHRERLESRRSVRSGGVPWWMPIRTRNPVDLFSPKLVTPHLILVPRFGLDADGQYAVSRSPYLIPKQEGSEIDLLRYFSAVLNSSAAYWYIAMNSHKYRSGYAMLEKGTLDRTPVPDPSNISPRYLRQVLTMAERRSVASGVEAIALQDELDIAVAELYGLTVAERAMIGMVS